jgi:hypothetical protein
VPVVGHAADQVGGTVIVIDGRAEEKFRLRLRRLRGQPLAIVLGKLRVAGRDGAAGNWKLLTGGWRGGLSWAVPNHNENANSGYQEHSQCAP